MLRRKSLKPLLMLQVVDVLCLVWPHVQSLLRASFERVVEGA